MSLAERVRGVAEKRAAFVHSLEGLDPEGLSWRPADDGWSLLDIVEHLVLAEQDVLVNLDDLAGLPAKQRTLANALRYRIVLGVLRFRVPVPVPSEGMKPKGGRTLAELEAVWRTQHDQLIAFLESLRPGEEKAAVFRHPVTGPMRIDDAVRMLAVHLERHLGQAERTLRAWRALTPP